MIDGLWNSPWMVGTWKAVDSVKWTVLFVRYTPSLGSGYSQFSHRHFLVGFGQKLFIYSQLTR